MAGTPLLVHPEGRSQALRPVTLQPVGTAAFDEAWLQALVHAHPALLPLNEIEPGLGELVSVCRELPTFHGSVDNLLMTAAGDLVLVETKLWRNPEARRRVLMQALDYATALFAMDYTTFEQSVLRARFDPKPKPTSLYALFEGAEQRPEAAFIDAVSANLRRGRATILVVGDGIRSETETLLRGLADHAQFQFTLALVELGVFRAEPDGLLAVVPRTLAKTTLLPRYVIEIRDHRAAIVTPPATGDVDVKRASSITAEQFYEAIEASYPGARAQLEPFFASLEPLGVRPEFLRSLNLKWDPPDGTRAVNLGYITRNGEVWVDAANWVAPIALSHAYIEDLARQLGLSVDTASADHTWTVRRDGVAPRLDWVLPRLPAWQRAIEAFVQALQAHYKDAAQGRQAAE